MNKKLILSVLITSLTLSITQNTNASITRGAAELSQVLWVHSKAAIGWTAKHASEITTSTGKSIGGSVSNLSKVTFTKSKIAGTATWAGLKTAFSTTKKTITPVITNRTFVYSVAIAGLSVAAYTVIKKRKAIKAKVTNLKSALLDGILARANPKLTPPA
ncbi:hypothetical protein HOM50_03905 [bacterium]|jgi:hypothetical protein|nr:hypothetical protein [bacterium]MBT5015523.1 hypothetical protein [bacterium]